MLNGAEKEREMLCGTILMSCEQEEEGMGQRMEKVYSPTTIVYSHHLNLGLPFVKTDRPNL